MENFVVIDLGSNSIRLRITQIMDGNFLRVTHQMKDYVRLSENMGPERTLKEEPMRRTIEALKKFKGIIDGLPNTRIKAIGTAATRQAKNQKEFLKRIKDEVGLDLEVISGEREAYLDYLGVAHTLPLHNCLVMDTGGASTELILVKDGQPVNLTSLPFGSVTISQQFHLEDAISAANLFQAMTVVEKSLSNLDWLLNAHKIPLVCLGGSNRTLAKIARNRWISDSDEVPDIHGFSLPADDRAHTAHLPHRRDRILEPRPARGLPVRISGQAPGRAADRAEHTEAASADHRHARRPRQRPRHPTNGRRRIRSHHIAQGQEGKEAQER